MNRSLRFALTASALLGALAVCVPATAFADAPAAGAHAERGHRKAHDAPPVQRALTLTSLSNAQRSQIEALGQEARTTHDPVRAARAKVLSALASQVERGAIDRPALAPALRDETNAVVAARLRQRSIAERLHTVLSASQCVEVGRGKDFLGPAPSEVEVRAKAERGAAQPVNRLEKKLPGATAEERAQIAARLRARAAR